MKGHKLRRKDEDRISYSELKRRFIYDSKSGVISRINGVIPTAKTKTGSVKSNGYHRIKIDNKHYLTHHLVWFWHNKKWPIEIDHIDRNKLNNRIDNLRECTHKENQQFLAKPIVRMNDGRRYNSIINAAHDLGVRGESISKSIKRKGKCCGYMFKYA